MSELSLLTGRVASLTLVMSLSSCSPISREQVAQDVQAVTKPGERIQVASANLKNAGFDCGRNYLINAYKGDMLCSRRGGSNNILYGCIQRVFIDLDTAQRISRIRDPQVACVGL